MAKGKRKPKITPMQEIAMYIAYVVRNNIEDFHHDYLTDAQMKELNPLIRDAIYTALHALENQKANYSAKKYVTMNALQVPRYWEPPELTNDYIGVLNMRFDAEGNYLDGESNE